MLIDSKQVRTYAVRWHEVHWTPDPTRHSYFLPPGHDFLESLMAEMVEVYVGGELLDANAYTAVQRARLNPTFAPHPSVRDAAIGVKLAAIPAAAVTLRWQERTLWGLEDPVVARVRVLVDNNMVPATPRTFDLVGPNGSLKVWLKNTNVPGNTVASKQTNALELPRLPEGMFWEVWRRTRRDGGGRGSPTRYPRDGRRFVPYIRLAQAAIGKNLYHWTDLALTRQRRHITTFRAYDPATGARGPVARETIRWYPAKDACWTEGSPSPTTAVVVGGGLR